MKKISTLFKKDPNDLSRVLDEVDPANAWALTDRGVVASIKRDGTAMAVIDGRCYRRYDAKRYNKGKLKGTYKEPPIGAIPCQEADEVSGHQPFWVPCLFGDPDNKYYLEAFSANQPLADGTYEICGPKVATRGGVNPEGFNSQVLIRHGSEVAKGLFRGAAAVKDWLKSNHHEGLVFAHSDGRMCKIRRKDFGLSWPVEEEQENGTR